MQLFTALGSRLTKALVHQVAVDLISWPTPSTVKTRWWGPWSLLVTGPPFGCTDDVTATVRAVERATAPYQYALNKRAGCECIAHILQGITELHPELTITSIDGIGAFDTIPRESMMSKLLEVEGGGLPPFVRIFTVPHRNTWGEDDTGFRMGREENRATP